MRASIDIKPLRFAWLVVLCSQIDSAALGFALTAADIVFILTVLSGAVISIESIVKPKLVLVGGDKWHWRFNNLVISGMLDKYTLVKVDDTTPKRGLTKGPW